jgi:hypothetical protein
MDLQDLEPNSKKIVLEIIVTDNELFDIKLSSNYVRIPVLIL